MKVLPTLRSIIFTSVVSSASIHVAAQSSNDGFQYLRGDLPCGAGAAIGIGNTFGQAVEAIARQPEAENKIVQAAVLGAVLARSSCENMKDIVNEDFDEALDKLFEYFESVGNKKQLRLRV